MVVVMPMAVGMLLRPPIVVGCRSMVVGVVEGGDGGGGMLPHLLVVVREAAPSSCW